MNTDIVKCPACSQKLKVPTNRGSILITCGKCSLKWMWEPREEKSESEEVSAETQGGIKSWLSKAKNTITGGSAEVLISTNQEEVKPGEGILIDIKVNVADFPLKAKRVYVELVGEEITDLSWNTVRQAIGKQFNPKEELINLIVNRGRFVHKEITFEGEYECTKKIEWEPNAKGEMSINIEIPSNAVASFRGVTIVSQWRVRAVVETSVSVSPKSEWIGINVIPR